MTRPSPTHFLCIPLINSLSRTQLDVSLNRLRDAAVALRIPRKAFRPIGTLHLTLGVMDLKEGSRLKEAIRLLNGPEIAQTIRDMISRELYIHPEDTASRLLPLCQRFQEIFKSSGFIIPENRPLRLHATVINTRYVSKGNFPPKIDATSIVRQFKEEIWAENVALERLAICKMGTEKVLDPTGAVIDEQYRVVAYVNFA